MKRIITLLAFFTFMYGINQAQVLDTIVKWTFPSGTPVDSLADGGIVVNLDKAIKTFGAGPVGFANMGYSTRSARATGWDNGADTKYWQVFFTTVGYDSLFLTSKQRSSNTGPGNFKIQYKIGSIGTWVDIPNATVADTSAWTQMYTDSLPSACNNTDSVYIRWIMTDDNAVNGSAVISSGASNIDDIKIWGHNISGITPPMVLNAHIVDLSNVMVVFSEAVSSTAENTANYTGLGAIATAVRSASLDTVMLNLASPLIIGDAYTLTVDNVEDTSGTAMALPQSFNFLFNNTIAGLVITEINYNDPSSGASADTLEYIEIYNNSASIAIVGGYRLMGRVNNQPVNLYLFPAGNEIPAYTYLVFAKNINAVNNFYSITGAIQWATGQSLSNANERISIINTVGDFIDSLTYRITAPWPIEANAGGPSLTLCDPSTDNSVAANWTASTEFVDSLNAVAVYGTPGGPCIPTHIKNQVTDVNNVACFPNPVNDNFTLTVSSQAKEVMIYNILGNVVYQNNKPSLTNNINTVNLNRGIYFVKVTFNNNTMVTKKVSVNR